MAPAAPAPADALGPEPALPPSGGVVPKSGAGLRAGGITLLVQGTFTVLLGALILPAPGADSNNSRAQAFGWAFVSAGFLELGGGTYMAIVGSRRKQALARWSIERNIMAPPRDGNGMTVMGSILLGASAVGFVGLAASNATRPDEASPATYEGPTIYAVGGAALLGAGLWRRSRYRKWVKEDGYQLAFTPYAAPRRGGASFGFAGRF